MKLPEGEYLINNNIPELIPTNISENELGESIKNSQGSLSIKYMTRQEIIDKYGHLLTEKQLKLLE